MTMRDPTTNPCRLCAPLGASLVFRGISGGMPLLHGGQGCATYIRRYLISHFREPMDVASSSFGEQAAVFGGEPNLHAGLDNLIRQYQPALVGVATTCLAETIGEDVPAMLRRWRMQHPDGPELVPVSTPSYQGSHVQGFHAAVAALVAHFAEPMALERTVALFPGMISPADLRHLREIAAGCGIEPILVPDYADTLDGPTLSEWTPLPTGGTTIADLRRLGGCRAGIQLGRCADPDPAAVLTAHAGTPASTLGLPLGVRSTDAFIQALTGILGTVPAPWLAAERGRLLDAYVDGHKYAAGARVAVVADEDLAAALAGWLTEIGCRVVLVGSGGRSGRLLSAVAAAGGPGDAAVADQDHAALADLIAAAQPDLLIGPSKCAPAARALDLPLVRCGFPIHDRLGAQRLLTVGYRGTLRLFDEVVNTLLARKQAGSEVGHAYL